MSATKYVQQPIHTVGVVVKFFQGEAGWSRPYTYAWSFEVPANKLVLVPRDSFCSVARVKESILNYDFDPEINYKTLIRVLDLSFGDI